MADELQEPEVDEVVSQESQQVEATEQTQATKETNDRLRELLAANGVALDGSDEDVAKQLAETIKTRREEKEQLRAKDRDLQKYQEELDRLSRGAEQTPPKESKEEKRRRLERLEFPKEYLQFAKIDSRTGVYVPREGMGPLAVKAAEFLNQAQQEKDRRAEKMLEDPVSFMLESGLEDELETRLSKVLSGFEEKIKASVAEQQAAQARQRQEAELDKFRDTHKGEIFNLDSKGDIKFGLDGKPVLTEQGKVFAERLEDATKSGVDPLYAVKTAYEISRLSVASKQPPKPEEKRRDFIDKAREVQNGTRRVSPQKHIDDQEDQPTSFMEYLKRQPEYQELIKKN